jgi:hypothetical protein
MPNRCPVEALLAIILTMTKTLDESQMEKAKDKFLELHVLFRDSLKERRARPLASIYLLKPESDSEERE